MRVGGKILGHSGLEFAPDQQVGRIENKHALLLQGADEISIRAVVQRSWNPGKTRGKVLRMHPRLDRCRHHHKQDSPLIELPLEIENRRAGVGQGRGLPFGPGSPPACQIARVQESGAGEIVHVRPVEKPSVTPDVGLLVADAGVAAEQGLQDRADPLPQPRFVVQAVLEFGEMPQQEPVGLHDGGDAQALGAEGFGHVGHPAEKIEFLRAERLAAGSRIAPFASHLEKRHPCAHQQEDTGQRQGGTGADGRVAGLFPGHLFTRLLLCILTH